MTTYAGSCHCGKVAFDVDIDLSKPAMTCNCSICQRSGTMLSFVPLEKFKLKSGDDVLTEYKWGKKHINHNFCSVCGVRSFARGSMPDGTKMIAINVRCLENVDLEKVPTQKFDGRSR